MRQLIYSFARSVSRAPLLSRLNFLRPMLRKPLEILVPRDSRRVSVSLSGKIPISIPADLEGAARWDEYEPESIAVLAGWLRAHPDGVVLDIGSAIGVYSVGSLAGADRTRVIACDSNLAALKITDRMCSFDSERRLRLVYGFVSDKNTDTADVERLDRECRDLLVEKNVLGKGGTNEYICIGQHERSIPEHTIDHLLQGAPYAGRDTLLKLDIEGAEQLALQGATGTLARDNVTVLLSVHPEAVKALGGSKNELRDMLESSGLTIDVIAVDHEEHWYCTR